MLWVEGSSEATRKKAHLALFYHPARKLNLKSQSHAVFSQFSLKWEKVVSQYGWGNSWHPDCSLIWVWSRLVFINFSHFTQQFLCQSQVISTSLHLLGLHQPLWSVCLLPRLHSAHHPKPPPPGREPRISPSPAESSSSGKHRLLSWESRLRMKGDTRQEKKSNFYQFSQVPAMVWKNYDKKTG